MTVAAYVEKGKALEMIKKYDDAIKNYNELILINPKASFALFRIGFCFEKKRDQSNALKFYKQCLEIDPKMDKAYYRISMFHYRKIISKNL